MASAAVLVVAAAALLRLPGAPPAGQGRAPLPTVSVTNPGPTGSSPLLAEKLKLDDPTLLFMPADAERGETLLNGSLRPDAGVPAATVTDQKLSFSPDSLGAGTLAVQFSEPVPAPQNALEGLRLTERPDAPLTLGRTDNSATNLPTRTGWVEAVATAKTANSQVAWSGELGRSDRVPAGDWDPLELLGAVAPSGLVGNLVVTRSSGSETVDNQIRQLLTLTLHVGQRLPPGIYTFRVGP